MIKPQNKRKLWIVADRKQADVALIEHLVNEIKVGLGKESELDFLPVRSSNSIFFTISAFFFSCRNFQKGDSVLLFSTPRLLPFLIAAISLRRGATYSLLMINANKKNPRAEERGGFFLFSDFSGLFYRWLFKYASKIVVCEPEKREIFEKKTAGLDVPVIVIPFSVTEKK